MLSRMRRGSAGDELARSMPKETRAARMQRWDRKSTDSLWGRKSKESEDSTELDASLTPRLLHRAANGGKASQTSKSDGDIIRLGLGERSSTQNHSPTTIRMQKSYVTDAALKTMESWEVGTNVKSRSMSMPEIRPSTQGRAKSSAISSPRVIFELPADGNTELGVRATAPDRFELKELARYLLSRCSFTHPVSRRPLAVDECKRLDSHLTANGLASLAKVGDACAAHVESTA